MCYAAFHFIICCLAVFSMPWFRCWHGPNEIGLSPASSLNHCAKLSAGFKRVPLTYFDESFCFINNACICIFHVSNFSLPKGSMRLVAILDFFAISYATLKRFYTSNEKVSFLCLFFLSQIRHLILVPRSLRLVHTYVCRQFRHKYKSFM